MAINKCADNPISRFFQAYQKVVPFPAANALLAGGLVYGLGRLAWNPIVQTTRSLGRAPIMGLFGASKQNPQGLTQDDYQEAFDNLKSSSKYRWLIPLIFGGTAAAAVTGLHWKPGRQYGGMFSWNAPMTSYVDKKNTQPALHSTVTVPETDLGLNKTTGPMQVSASLHKRADQLFDYGGYVPDMDWSKSISVSDAKSLFSNDKHLQNQDYVRNLGTSIVTNAAITSGTYNPTLGSVFDSAADKFSKKLSFQGVLTTATNTVVANGLARLFTSAVGAMTDISPNVRKNIIDAGTWAGAITSILN